MKWHREAAMMGSGNEYSHLKWPLTFASILTTVLAIILMFSFRSNSWFTYDLVHIDNRTTIPTTTYSRILEYGSVGLWRICVGNYTEPDLKCDVWTKETRPHSFNVIIVLLSCALFIANLTVFPSWGASILILYNINNRYIRSIFGFVWILFLLTLSLTLILLVAMLLSALTQFYSPGHFIIDTKHLFFHSGHGLLYAGFATFLSMVSLLLVIVTIIWKKMIEMRLIETERDLLNQATDDNYRPGWHRIVMAPRTPTTNDQINAPPPYQY